MCPYAVKVKTMHVSGSVARTRSALVLHASLTAASHIEHFKADVPKFALFEYHLSHHENV